MGCVGSADVEDVDGGGGGRALRAAEQNRDQGTYPYQLLLQPLPSSTPLRSEPNFMGQNTVQPARAKPVGDRLPCFWHPQALFPTVPAWIGDARDALAHRAEGDLKLDGGVTEKSCPVD